MARIFLSHSSRDNAETIGLRDWLSKEGWDDVFLDLDAEAGLKAGERWQEALKQASERCEMVVFVISPNWVASRWCLAEFLLAKQMNKRIFGVLVAPTPFEDLPVEMTAEWQLVDLTAGARDYTATVTLPPGNETQEIAFSDDGLKRLRIGLQNAGLDPRFFAWPPADDPHRPPYRGLRPLEAEDAGIFFGREGPIVHALDHLRGLRHGAPPRLMVILGASGAGKSSFMRAGLLPRLMRDDRHFRTLPILRPDRAALSGETGLIASLEAALIASGHRATRGEVRKAVSDGPDAVRKLLRTLAQPLTGDTLPPTLILPVDQAEELFSADGQEEATQFLTLLASLASVDDPALAVIFTIRSDGYEALQTAEPLSGLLQQTYSLPPVPKGAYGQIIEGPAKRLAGTDRSLSIEDTLIDALMRDIEEGGAKDSLPLLSFTMERLYREYGGDGDLKLTEYQDTGGVRGSIEAAVERALQAADADNSIPKDRAERLSLIRRGLIPWLAGIDHETGAPRRRVARKSDIPSEAVPLVELLVDQRLLSTDIDGDTGEITIEPAHEALLRQWGSLQGWLEEDFEDLSTAEGLRRAAREWDANARDAEWLAHGGGRLELAAEVAGRADFRDLFSDIDRSYLAAASHAETARQAQEAAAAKRLLQRTLVGLVVALALALAAGFFALQAKNQTRIAEAQSEVATQQADLANNRQQELLASQSRFLADLSRQNAAAGNGSVARLLALEGTRDETPGPDGLPVSDRPRVPKAEQALQSALFIETPVQILSGHRGGITSVDISKDAAIVASSSEDGTVRIWDRVNGASLHVIEVGKTAVVAVAFSPDAGRLVSGSADGSAVIWDVTTGTELVRLAGHDYEINGVAFSPDGRSVATASSDLTARVWDASTGEQIAAITGHDDLVLQVDYGADSATVATVSYDGTAQILDLRTGRSRVLKDWGEKPTGKGTAIAISPDGRETSVGYASGQIIHWSNQDVPITRRSDREGGASLDIDYSGDGRFVAMSSIDGIAHVAEYPSLARWVRLAGHGGAVRGVALSEDGAWAVTGARDGLVRIWANRGRASNSTELTGPREAEESIPLISSDLLSDKNQAILAWRDELGIWDLGKNELIASVDPHQGRMTGMVLTPDGRSVVTVGGDGALRVWSVESGSMISQVDLDAEVTHAAISPDGRLVVTAQSDGGLRVWDFETLTETARMTGHTELISVSAFTPDNSRLVTGSLDGTARVWDLSTGREMHRIDDRREPIVALALSPDASTYVIGGQNGRAAIYDIATGDQISVLKGQSGMILSVNYDAEGDRIVTGATDWTVRLWDRTTGAQITVMEGHGGNVNSAVFTADGSRIVSVSDDQSARMWNAETGAELVRFDTPGAGGHRAAVFDETGQRVLVGTELGAAHLWSLGGALDSFLLTAQKLVDRAKSDVPRCLTSAEREQFFLSPEPPRWCVTSPGSENDPNPENWNGLYPYDTDAWRAWLAARDRGEAAPIPKKND